MHNKYPYKTFIAALSAVIGVVGSYEHVAALCSYVLILYWLHYKKYPRVLYVVTCGVMLFFFAYSEYVQQTLTKDVAQQQIMTWTDRHTIRGDTVRG
ncbi:MAG: hypothetical protein UHX00_00585, partial [Caryophanon sp.]|nr:hypothetical protein [Caryophanon sp.]